MLTFRVRVGAAEAQVRQAYEMFGKKRPSDKLLHCSFCDKSQRDVKKLIAGPHVQICDECVNICLDVISEGTVLEDGQNPPIGRGWSPPRVVLLCALCRCSTPHEHSLHVHNRGVICAGCIGAVQAALAERDEPSSAPEA